MKTIKLTNEQIKLLESCKNQKEIGEIGFRAACSLLKEIHSENWEKIKFVFSDLKLISINFENWTIDIEE